MKYSSPEVCVYDTVNVVMTSEFIEDDNSGNSGTSGNSGGIQLPFIPG